MFIPPFNVGNVLGETGEIIREQVRVPSTLAMEKLQKHVLKIKSNKANTSN